MTLRGWAVFRHRAACFLQARLMPVPNGDVDFDQENFSRSKKKTNLIGINTPTWCEAHIAKQGGILLLF